MLARIFWQIWNKYLHQMNLIVLVLLKGSVGRHLTVFLVRSGGISANVENLVIWCWRVIEMNGMKDLGLEPELIIESLFLYFPPDYYVSNIINFPGINWLFSLLFLGWTNKAVNLPSYMNTSFQYTYVCTSI